MVTAEYRSTTTVLGTATIADFRRSLRGTLILPTDDGYDADRRVFNGMIDRRPAMIAHVADTADIARCIQFARSHALPLSIRSGGHNVAGHAVCDDGLVIDLAALKQVTVDRQTLTARAGAGLRLGEFITTTEQYGLVSPTGTVSDTGIGGLTLGGGYGWLSSKFGLAVDNIAGAEVVTADGMIVHASRHEHPDLFWALRGGGGNFGVVSTFELQLHPVSQVLGGFLIHPFNRATELLHFHREFAVTTPEELTTSIALVTTPDGHQVAAMVPCWCGELDAGERVLAPARQFGAPVADLVRPMRYSEMNTLLDAANPPGLLNYWKHIPLRELNDTVIDTVIRFTADVPSPLTAVLIEQLRGAAARAAPTATAFAHRNAPFSVVIIAMWDDPADSERNVTWARELATALTPWSTGGTYSNAINDGEDRARAAFGVNYERLLAVKNRYDPTNLFHFNQNIVPTV